MDLRPKGRVSPYARANVGRRFIAAAIDGLLVATFLGFAAALGSVLLAIAGAVYLLLRDALFIPGQSVGKFLLSLLVISLETGRPCSRTASARRNLLFLVPGLNLVAIPYEALAVVRDPQGQRLGDRLAQTQVVEGVGARELIKAVQKELQEELLEIQPLGKPSEEPFEVK
jgi:uncharacterized RDD family membrane protein YckC